jgi:hypothetical protein
MPDRDLDQEVDALYRSIREIGEPEDDYPFKEFRYSQYTAIIGVLDRGTIHNRKKGARRPKGPSPEVRRKVSQKMWDNLQEKKWGFKSVDTLVILAGGENKDE